MFKPLIVASQAGIKRDGTVYEGEIYTDGQWTRFQRNLPRKIFGYFRLSNELRGICRGLRTYTQTSVTYVHLGYADGLERLTISPTGTSAISDRTPTSLALYDSNIWQFDIIVDTTSLANPVNLLVAQVAPNSECICNSVGGQLFFGELTEETALEEVVIPGGLSITGGLVALHPYLVIFGNDGSLAWSAPGRPSVFYNFEEELQPYTVNSVSTNTFQFTLSSGTALVIGDVIAFGPFNQNVTYTVVNVTNIATTYTVTVDRTIVGVSTGAAIYKESTTATGAGNARVASQKIVRGLPLRSGAGNSPAGIFWAADAVVRMTFVGGDLVFQFDTLSSQSSILSAASVIEYDGVYYWVGTDRFLTFNGVVRDLPNGNNINWFFDNLNRVQAQKVFAYKVPRFGEIWWCFPFGNATECTHAVIYNIKENSWYDTVLPNGGRSAGEFSPVYAHPVLTGVAPIYDDSIPPVDTYRLWQHEIGFDEVDGTTETPIKSFIETADFSVCAQPNGLSKWLKVYVLEPDFVQRGQMSVQLIGRTNARSADRPGNDFFYPAVAFTPEDQVIYFKEQFRQLRFRFTSDDLGGDYQMGQVIAHVEETDGSILGAVHTP